MDLFIPGRVVVFDYGEVISRAPDPSVRAALADLVGVPWASMQPAYDAFRNDLDAGRITVVEYWRRIAEATGAGGTGTGSAAPWSITTIHRLWAVDFTGWFTVDPDVLDIVERLRAAGTRVALLSNAGHDFGDPYRHSPMASLFELVVVSAEEGVLKPDPAIYRATCDRLGIAPEQMVFVDNKQENADGAVAIGATGHHFHADGDRSAGEGLLAFLGSLAIPGGAGGVSDADSVR